MKGLDDIEVLVAAVTVVLVGWQAGSPLVPRPASTWQSTRESANAVLGCRSPVDCLRDRWRRPVTDRSLSHLDPFSGTRMVDVSPKEATHRRALARCKVAMKPETTAKVANNAITKGDVLAAARVAGIQAAKRTADLVPMCHPLLVGAVHVDFTIGDDFVEVEAKVEAVDRTGVEMEAMTACAIAALTVYDMCKTTDRTMSIGQLMLWEKTGGSSGIWKRDPLD